jgi:Tol biopolymer transport system component/imidazolonepropionase-like amidohydrolase
MRLALILAVLFIASPTVGIGQDNDSEWDIEAIRSASTTVEFTTDEGTWMNLDVSPDGSEIVFDLLGDIYIMPVSGGQARLLTGGQAYNVQPRFSPDGRYISFASDRAGGDNIWIMGRDGSNATQVTKEDFRLLNNPIWTPDGDYFIARKHFTSTRSLGAGEMWMYHRSGGSGLQLTQRRNDQQDAGEPAISPDGRYLYFSEDMSPGGMFQYNKDPNTQIYVVRRLDRETGELTNLITGAGGAVRPQVSPDGRFISFVRRIRNKSVLHVYDTETGAHMPIWDGLSKDQQEAWAIFGVYPNHAWTPDGESVIIWAQGRIHRVNIAERTAEVIPFEADVRKEVHEAIRFNQEVAPDQFHARMIRDAATSADGRTLVFHAIGSLWRMQLPNGTPQRLTNDDHFEYSPSFSPDGRSILYTTWSDSDLGAIYRIDLDGRNKRKLTDRKGYYFTPRFSPDGSQIVYRRGSGNNLLGQIHGVETGLYVMPANGGEPSLVTRSGSEPRFAETGDRIYFQTGGGLSKSFHSIDLNGNNQRTHFNMKYAGNVVPSPDGRWVAFTDLHNAYIAPFPRTGDAVELSKDTRAFPVRQVTKDAGFDLHWSADSERLHWVYGPEYFTRELRQTFAFVDGAPDELPEPEATGTPIRLTVETDRPTGSVAFTNARIITMRGDEVIENGTVVVDRNRISAVGASGNVQIPSEAHVVDASGKTIMPGMVDVHAHASHFGSGPVPQQNWPYYANLAYGVTTIHDPSANTQTVFGNAEKVQAGRMVGPRVFSTGTILYGADGDFKAVVNSLDDARSHLRRMQAVGAFSVKSYNQPRRDQRQQVLQAARELGMLVFPEGGSTFFHNMSMVIDGHTGIEHNIPVAPLYRDVREIWKATEVGYSPTLVVSYGGLSGEYYWYEHTNVWEDERLLNFTPRPMVDARSRRRQMTPLEEYWHIDVARAGADLVRDGGRMLLGSHGQMQGIAAHWELWSFEQGGLTPLESIRAATIHGAEYLGLDNDLGSIEVGKLADLVILSANPLDDLRNTTEIEYVMINGRLFDAMTMNEIGNHPRERAPFWFEREETSDAFVWQGEADAAIHTHHHGHSH